MTLSILKSVAWNKSATYLSNWSIKETYFSWHPLALGTFVSRHTNRALKASLDCINLLFITQLSQVFDTDLR